MAGIQLVRVASRGRLSVLWAMPTIESSQHEKQSPKRIRGTRIGTNLRGYRWDGKDRGVGSAAHQPWKIHRSGKNYPPGGTTNESIPAEPAHTTTKVRPTAAGRLRPWSLNQYPLSCQLHRPRVRVLRGDFADDLRACHETPPAQFSRSRWLSIASAEIPCWTRQSRTAWARRSENCRWYWSPPTLSVYPSTARCRLGIRQHNAENFGQTLTRSGSEFEAAALKQYLRHICDQATC